MKVKLLSASDRSSWDAYVHHHPASTHCHLSGWKGVIEKAYGHRGYYFIAEEDSRIWGVLPLFHLKSLLFGNQLVSMPFLNYGGILSESEDAGFSLLQEAIRLASDLRASSVELRHLDGLKGISARDARSHEKTHKVRMVLRLPGSSEALFRSFKSKLRSQISRPEKAGLKGSIGGAENLDAYYRVFSINMRDLGSPVHSKKFFRQILEEFGPNAQIGLVHDEAGLPAAAGLILCFRETVEIPWASSLRKFNSLSPNMLLYWSLLKYACDGKYAEFDFGRCTPGEGTHRFKEQWGATGIPLHWQYWTPHEKNGAGVDSGKPRVALLISLWQKLPLPLSTWLGPKLRRSISL
jgi:FemAB-related protein (PEP-CTERM system-associated)